MRCALVLLVLVARDATAETVTESAKRLFDEGRALKDAGDARACDRFAASYELVAAAGTGLNLAECMEAQQKYVRAVQLYTAAATAWDRESDRKKSASLARERAAALRSKVVEVVVELDEPRPDQLTLTIGDRRVTPAPAIREIFDPGDVQISAAAPGYQPFAKTLRAASGETLRVRIPSLRPIVDATPVPAPATGPRRRSYVVASIALGALGAGGMVAGGLVFLDARDRQADGDDDAARTRADLATGLGVAGVALVVAAAVVFVKAPRTRVTLTATATSAGLAFAF